MVSVVPLVSMAPLVSVLNTSGVGVYWVSGVIERLWCPRFQVHVHMNTHTVQLHGYNHTVKKINVSDTMNLITTSTIDIINPKRHQRYFRLHVAEALHPPYTPEVYSYLQLFYLLHVLPPYILVSLMYNTSCFCCL